MKLSQFDGKYAAVLRERAEHAIRRLHTLEVEAENDPVVDYDCSEQQEKVEPFSNRLDALVELSAIRRESFEPVVTSQLDAHITYLSALMGQQYGLNEYIIKTQGCASPGWSEDYINYRLDVAQKALQAVGISWSEDAKRELDRLEGYLSSAEVGESIRRTASEYEGRVRELCDAAAEFTLTVENVDSREYWAYWLDGAGYHARLRINTARASFTKYDSYRFALHEVLGHALQYANLTAHADDKGAKWPRILAVHSNHQVCFEGLAQALPLILRPDDQLLNAAVRLEHYSQIVRAEIHIQINAGVAIEECVKRAIERAPFLKVAVIEREMKDRGRNPRLRSYLWSYPAGIDWFINLFEQRPGLVPEVLRAAYKLPLSPSQLHQFWPTGPSIGGDNV